MSQNSVAINCKKCGKICNIAVKYVDGWVSSVESGNIGTFLDAHLLDCYDLSPQGVDSFNQYFNIETEELTP